MLAGADAHANPVEYALASLASCQAITYRFWAAKLGIQLDGLEIAAEGDLDLHGFFGLDGDVARASPASGSTSRRSGRSRPSATASSPTPSTRTARCSTCSSTRPRSSAASRCRHEAFMSALAASDVGTLRRIHLGMIDAVLAGGGVEPVAALAAERLGGTVAIVLPAVDVAIGPPRFAAYVGRPPARPAGPRPAGRRGRGARALGRRAARLRRAARRAAGADAREVLELAAVAALTAVTLRDANVSRRRAAAALFDDLRAGEDVARPRAPAGRRPLAAARARSYARGPAERVLAVIAQEVPGRWRRRAATASRRCCPATPRSRGGSRAGWETSGLSPFGTDLARALRYAELALEVGARGLRRRGGC